MDEFDLNPHPSGKSLLHMNTLCAAPNDVRTQHPAGSRVRWQSPYEEPSALHVQSGLGYSETRRKNLLTAIVFTCIVFIEPNH